MKKRGQANNAQSMLPGMKEAKWWDEKDVSFGRRVRPFLSIATTALLPLISGRPRFSTMGDIQRCLRIC